MKCNFIHIKIKEKSNLTHNKKKILDIIKLSFENDIILNYNKNKKTNNNLQIIYYKKYIKNYWKNDL